MNSLALHREHSVFVLAKPVTPPSTCHFMKYLGVISEAPVRVTVELEILVLHEIKCDKKNLARLRKNRDERSLPERQGLEL